MTFTAMINHNSIIKQNITLKIGEINKTIDDSYGLMILEKMVAQYDTSLFNTRCIEKKRKRCYCLYSPYSSVHVCNVFFVIN